MAAIGFTTDSTLHAKLELLVLQGDTTLSAAQKTEADRRSQQAYDHIIGVLMNRGLTKAQADTWRRGEEFQLDIATYWFLLDTGWQSRDQVADDWADRFDRRDELESVELLDDDFADLGPDDTIVQQFNLVDINNDLAENS